MLSTFPRLVVLVRHANAVSTEEDPTRPLSITGRQQAERMASWLAGLDPRFEEIRHSGKARAEQTAEIFARRLGVKASCLRRVGGLSPHDDPERIAADLETHNGHVMLVSHLPFIGRLASLMLTGDGDRVGLRFANAGVAALAKISGQWQLVALLSQEMVS
jgi:phosphohistidine phosphatase